MTDAVELVFETHSLTVDNERGVATGWRGGVLSDRGRRLAVGLGARRRDDAIDVVFCSDLARAVETAYIAFGDSEVPVVLDWRLREIDYGELNGAPVASIERERRRRVDAAFPGGESYREAAARVGDVLEEVRSRRRGTRILVIGHTATRWGLDHVLHGKPLEELVGESFDWREGWEYRVPRRQPEALPA